MLADGYIRRLQFKMLKYELMYKKVRNQIVSQKVCPSE